MNDFNGSEGVSFDLIRQVPGQPNIGRPRRDNTRGLPDENARRALATTYLKVQHRLWPQLVKAGVLPKKTEANVNAMAEVFRNAFETGVWGAFDHSTSSGMWKFLGTGYLRYSDTNSNPRSLDQQLLNILEKAKQLDIFIPWQYVFADSAVTGTNAARRGYALAKKLVVAAGERVNCLLIDEIGRASRDAIEALKLGRLIEENRKRMIGATDGFDSDQGTSKTQLHIFAMLHEWFVDQLRSKVNRGMTDAFQQGKNIHSVALGYKVVPDYDASGKMMLDQNNELITRRVIDAEDAAIVLKIFEFYADQSWSRGKIAKYLNGITFGGGCSWDDSMVRQLLRRSLYRGIENYGMTYHVRDHDSGLRKTIKRPSSEWKTRLVPEMRIVPDDLWDRVKERLDKTALAYARKPDTDKPNRSELHPKTLVRPYCGVCSEPMAIGRTGPHTSYFCNSGKTGKKNCSATGYKSSRIIDAAILERIAQEIFTEEFLDKIVEEANRALVQKPVNASGSNPDAVRTSIRKKEKSLHKIMELMDDEEDTSNLKSVFQRIKHLESEIAAEKEQLLAMTQVVPKPGTITLETVRGLMDDLRGLLQSDIGSAAPAIAAITGPVVISQVPNKKGGKPVWKARFTLNSVPILCELALKRKCPTASSLEYLRTAHWTNGSEVEVDLIYTPKYVLYAARAAEMEANGYDVFAITQLLKASPDTVKAALAYAHSGGHCPKKFLPIPEKPGKKTPDEIACEIVRLLDEDKLTLAETARRLKLNVTTVRNAYDRKLLERDHPFDENGKRKSRIRTPYLPQSVFDVIDRAMKEGLNIKEIAAAAGCGEGTVRRYIRDKKV